MKKILTVIGAVCAMGIVSTILATPVHAAISLIQAATSTDNTAGGAGHNQCAVTFPSATTASDTIVVGLVSKIATSSVTGITDTASDTFHFAAGASSTASIGIDGELWYSINIAGGTTVVTTTFTAQSSGEGFNCVAAEFSGITNFDSGIALATSSNASGMTSGNLTTNFSNEMILGAGGTPNSNSAIVPGSGFTKVSSSTGSRSIMEYQILSSAGSNAATANSSGGTTVWSMEAAGFYGANQPPTINSFSFSSTTIYTGSSSVLSWNVSSFTGSLTIVGNNLNLSTTTASGSVTVTPTSLNVLGYTLTANNANGTTTKTIYLSPLKRAGLNIGSAPYFDGQTGTITIPNPSNFSYSVPTTGQLTVCAWYNPSVLAQPNPTTSGSGYTPFIVKELGSGQDEWEFRMYAWPDPSSEVPVRFNRTSFYIYTPSGGEGAGGAFEDQIIPGQWVFVCGTVDSTYVSIYKNGVFQAATNWVTFPVTPGTSTAPITIGGSYNLNNGYFEGGVSDLQIWNRELTPAEIKSIYLNNAYISNGLVGQWQMNEGTGTTVFDTSGNSNNGTASGTFTWGNGPSFSRLSATNSNGFQSTGQTVITRNNGLLQRTTVAASATTTQLVSASSQYLSLASSSATSLNPGSDDFMLGGWFFIQPNGNFQELMAKYSSSSLANNAGAVGYELIYRGDQSTGGFQIRINDGTTNAAASYTTAPIAGKWVHLIAVVMRSSSSTLNISSTISLYVNGVRQSGGDNSPIATTGSLSNTGSFIVGRESGTGSAGYGNFQAHDLFYYDFGVGGFPNFQILQQQYVNPIYYNNTFPTSNLVAYWPLNGTTTDVFGGNNLTPQGSPTFTSTNPFAPRKAAAARTAAATRTQVP